MIRTQISLSKNDYLAAKRQAAALGISIAEFIRRAVREQLPVHGDGPWMRYAGFVESGNSRSSQTADEIVYGSKDQARSEEGSQAAGSVPGHVSLHCLS
jgi:hypothetical protein